MKPQKILIINDQQPVRWMLNQAVQSWGFTPVEAASAKSATDLARFLRPAVVLLDINFQGMDGNDILQQVKQSFPKTLIIVVTSKEGNDESAQKLLSKTHDFFITPVNLENLRKSILNGITSAKSTGAPRQRSRIAV